MVTEEEITLLLIVMRIALGNRILWLISHSSVSYRAKNTVHNVGSFIISELYKIIN